MNKIVLVIRGFDPIHSVNIAFFNQPKKLGDHLTTGWGQDTISDLKLGYRYGLEAESSGE